MPIHMPDSDAARYYTPSSRRTAWSHSPSPVRPCLPTTRPQPRRREDRLAWRRPRGRMRSRPTPPMLGQRRS